MKNLILDILYIGIVLQMVLSIIQQSTKEQFYKCFTAEIQWFNVTITTQTHSTVWQFKNIDFHKWVAMRESFYDSTEIMNM